MTHLRLVTEADTAAAADAPAVADDRPRLSLRLLMAASGRCSCDDCLLAYRAGDRQAGLVRVRSTAPQLTAVR